MAIDAREANLRLSWEEGDELVLSLDPLQGHWTVEQYLLLSNQTNRLLEYTDGFIEVLPIPTKRHQAISLFLLLGLLALIRPRGGAVYFVLGSASTPPLAAGGEARYNAVQCDIHPFPWYTANR